MIHVSQVADPFLSRLNSALSLLKIISYLESYYRNKNTLETSDYAFISQDYSLLKTRTVKNRFI